MVLLPWDQFDSSDQKSNPAKVLISKNCRQALMWLHCDLHDFLLETVVFTCVDVLFLLIMQCLCPVNPRASSCNSFYSMEMTLNFFFVLFFFCKKKKTTKKKKLLASKYKLKIKKKSSARVVVCLRLCDCYKFSCFNTCKCLKCLHSELVYFLVSLEG